VIAEGFLFGSVANWITRDVLKQSGLDKRKVFLI
jgi:hypothetical protein